MIQNPQQRFRTSFFYGWVIVFISALGIFFSGPGQTYSNAVFIDAYIEDFGWSRSLISSIYSIATLISGILLFFVGRFVDQIGHRKMSIIVAFLLGLASLWNSFVITPVMLFFGFFFIRFFGQGSMTLVHSTLVPQWFIKKRGRALSLMAIGGMISSALLPPINVWLIETWDWTIAWRFWAFLLIVLFMPLAYYIIRNRPEDIGLLPDGIDSIEQIKQKEGTSLEENWTLSEAIRTRVFWLVLFCAFIPAMINTGITFHLVSILGERGVDKTTAAFILSLFAIVGFPVTFIAGFVVERFRVHYVFSLAFLGQLGVMLLLLFSNSVLDAVLFGIARGIIEGFEAIILGIIWANYFGRKYLGSIRGISMTAMVIGSAFGPLPFGIAYDWFGTYNGVLLLMMLFPFLGMIAAILAPSPKKAKKEAKTLQSK